MAIIEPRKLKLEQQAEASHKEDAVTLVTQPEKKRTDNLDLISRDISRLFAVPPKSSDWLVYHRRH